MLDLRQSRRTGLFEAKKTHGRPMPWQFLKNAVVAYGGRAALGARPHQGSLRLRRCSYACSVSRRFHHCGRSSCGEDEQSRRRFASDRSGSLQTAIQGAGKSECAHVRRLYELASQDVAGYESTRRRSRAFWTGSRRSRSRFSSASSTLQAPTVFCIRTRIAILRMSRRSSV